MVAEVQIDAVRRGRLIEAEGMVVFERQDRFCSGMARADNETVSPL
jgi:hypothetical protein